MTILFPTDQYLPSQTGVVNGISVYLANIKKELEKRGHRCLILTAGNPSQKEKDLFLLPSIQFPGRPEDQIVLPFNKKIVSQLLKESIDVVHDQLFLTSIMGRKIAKEKNIPHLVTYHTMFPYLVKRMTHLPESLSTPLSHRVSRWYFNQFDKVLCPSNKAKLTLDEAGVKAPSSVIYNGIPTSKFKNTPDSLFYQKYNQVPLKRIVITGRVDEGKNVPLAVEAFSHLNKKHPDTQLVIVGEGVEKGKVLQKIKQYKLEKSVLYLGWVDQEMVSSVNHSASVALFLSTVDTLSTTAIEQATAGLPFVSVNDLGVTDICREGINASYTPLSAGKIAESMEKLLFTPKLLEKYKKGSSEVAKEFMIETSVDKLERIYTQEIRLKRSN